MKQPAKPGSLLQRCMLPGALIFLLSLLAGLGEQPALAREPYKPSEEELGEIRGRLAGFFDSSWQP